MQYKIESKGSLSIYGNDSQQDAQQETSLKRQYPKFASLL